MKKSIKYLNTCVQFVNCLPLLSVIFFGLDFLRFFEGKGELNILNKSKNNYNFKNPNKITLHSYLK